MSSWLGDYLKIGFGSSSSSSIFWVFEDEQDSVAREFQTGSRVSLTMNHAIYRVTSVQAVRPYSLKVCFDDGMCQEIDFRPVLEGDLLGPLKDATLFDQVTIDPEVHTLVWPNGADFDPAVLHDWPQHAEAFRLRAREWAGQPA